MNADGRREILGLEVVTQEDGAAWLAFLRGLVARGLSGVALVTSDAHEGLKAAIAATLPGAAWQRCRTHFMRNLLTRVPKSAQPLVATLVRTIFTQVDARATRHQHAVAVAELEPHFPQAAALLAEAREELLAFSHFDPSTGARSGRPTRRSGSTASCAGAATSSASSRTAARSSGSSARSWPSSTTSGR